MMNVHFSEKGTVERQRTGELAVGRERQGAEPSILADIYNEEVNIAIWQRPLSQELHGSVDEFLKANPDFERNQVISVKKSFSSIAKLLGTADQPKICGDIAELVEMFCYLFDLKRAGLRLAVLNRAMCPRFHVDNVVCRLVTTYSGVATEWLPHELVNREKLGTGNGGLPDCQSGLFDNEYEIRKLGCGDVALLKGERWQGNEGAGLVHRSPNVDSVEGRLLLTLDFSV